MKSLLLTLVVIASSAWLLCAKETPAVVNQLRHLVGLKFKADTTPEQIQKVENAFRALKTKIPEIVALEWGTNVSKENLAKGYTHCFLLTFKSEKDCDTYAHHAEHKAFVENLKPVLTEAFVFDYWAKE